MQLVNGESLEQRLKRVKTLSVPEVARLGMQAAAGLAAAHAGGLIHRDIKPGNILLESPSDRVKLTDFGLARAVEDVKLTRTGFVAGSPLYMAPEQARGEEVDHRADLFSLGSVLYESVTGKPAFDAKTPLAVLRRVADESPKPLHDVSPDVPVWLSDIVDKLLAKNPADRFQNASEVAEEFAGALAREHALSPLDVPAEVCPSVSRSSTRTRQPICWKGVAFRVVPWLGGAVLGALLGVLLWPRDVVEKAFEKSTVREIATKELKLGVAERGKVAEPAIISGAEELAKNEVVSQATEDIRKQVDFAKEKLVVFGWDGAGEDGVVGELNGTATNMTAAFTYIQGTSRDQYHHARLFVVPRNAEVKVEKTISIHPLTPVSGPTPKVILTGNAGTVWSLAFLGSDRLVVGMDDGSVKIWDLKKGSVSKALEPRLGGTVWSVDVSADGKRLVTTSDDSRVYLWDLDTYKVAKSYPQPSSTKAAVFNSDGTKLATGDRNATIRVWDVRADIPVELHGHHGTVHSLAFSPDGTMLASAGSDGTAKLWNLTGDGPGDPVTLGEHAGPVWGVAFSPDGSKLATSGWDGTVRIWDARKGSQIQTIKAHDNDAWSVSFGGGGKWVASAGQEAVKVWNVETGEEIFSYRGTRAFHIVRFAKDGTTLAAGGRDGTVKVWEIKQP
jgi:hypothetical protein